MNRVQELRGLFLEWAEPKGLLNKDSVQAQTLKLTEEAGELFKAFYAPREQESGVDYRLAEIDALGDMGVVITILLKQLGMAYESIPTNTTLVYIPNPTAYMVIGLGGLSEAILKNKPDRIAANVSVILQAMKYYTVACNTTEEECLEHAWSEIQDRTGELINGSFVAEKDL